jgi:hypothetical protein
MSRPARTPAIAVALALAVAGVTLTTGCGSAAAPPPAPAAQTTLSVLSLDTSLVTPAGTWAVAVMGGSAAQYNDFWQLFLRPAGSTRWQLVTPPGTADNGGLVLAGSDGQSVVTGFRPSQKLTFSPLIETRDGGHAWSSLGPLDAALASTPDALAVKPGSGSLLALLAGGTAELAAPSATTWTTLASQRTLAATPPGRRCGLQDLTAATFTSSGIPVLAGTCVRPGTAGIFISRGGTWQAAGPAIPAALARQHISVLRLTRAAHGIAALLQAGAGSAASLRRLVRRRRRPLDTLAAAQPQRSGTDLRVIRTRRDRRDHHDREPGRHPHPCGFPLAAAATTAPRHRHAGPRPRRRSRRPGRQPRHAHRLAARTRRRNVDQGTGHPRPHPVRILNLSASSRPQPARRSGNHAPRKARKVGGHDHLSPAHPGQQTQLGCRPFQPVCPA